MSEKLEKKVFQEDGLTVQGKSFDEIDWPGKEDLRQGIIDYWNGKGMPKKVAEKYYGLNGSLSVGPSEEEIEAMMRHY